ncbi:hypothetical protein Ddc_01795 [Ditylenchus destructor]|nr:hypothetical protein Ddc_01795 [Ditylenchus destructor]
MPSYDALYSFAMGIVKKLGQLRKLLLEKTGQVNQAELELMNLQSSLLLTHAQMERLRLESKISNTKLSHKRPVSYHGDNPLDKHVKSELCFLLPMKLHGSRVHQHRNFQSSANIDTMVEANEQNIEVEFLRLFDYARCLSKICEENPSSNQKKNLHTQQLESVIHYRNGRGTVSPMNSPLIGDRRMLCASDTNKMSPIMQRMYSKDTRKCGRSQPGPNPATRRPLSWVDTKSTFAKASDDFGVTAKENTPNSSPLLKRVPLLGSPIQINNRRLVKQSSLQTKSNAQDSHQPLYDCPPKGNLTISDTSSDYNTIGSFHIPPEKKDFSTGSIFSRGGSSSLERTLNDPVRAARTKMGMNNPLPYSPQRHVVPTAPPMSLINSAISKLPQPHMCGSNGSGSSLRRGRPNSGRDSLSCARPATPGENGPQWPASLQSSPLLMRQSKPPHKTFGPRTSESPSFGTKFVHHSGNEQVAQHNQHRMQYMQQLATSQNPTEKNKQSGMENTAEAHNSGGASRIPKPAGGAAMPAAAKKAGTSWLSRFRRNSSRK